MSHGIQAQGSYSWSKCMDMGSGGLLGDPYANSLSSLMFFNRGGRRGLCDFNITHNFVLNYLWQVPTPDFAGASGAGSSAAGNSVASSLLVQARLSQSPSEVIRSVRTALMQKTSHHGSQGPDAETRSILAMSLTILSCSASVLRLRLLRSPAFANPLRMGKAALSPEAA
jgi:hypothetical protein